MVALLLLAAGLQDPGVTLDAGAGFTGTAYPDGWARVSAVVETREQPFDGELRATLRGGSLDPAVAVERLSLREGTRRRFAWDVYLTGFEREVLVELRQGGRVVRQAEARVTFAEDRERNVLVVGRGIPILRRFEEDFSLALSYGAAAALPDDVAPLLPLDTIVFMEPAALEFRQQEALRRWVETGGRLALATGRRFPSAQQGFWKEMMPVAVSGSRELALSIGREEVAVLAATGPIHSGAPLFDTSGVPLAVGAPRGRGATVFIALSMDEAGLEEWPPLERLWRAILDAPQETGPRQRRLAFASSEALARGLTPGEAGIAPGTVAIGLLLLVAYALLIGPYDYLRLARRGTLRRGWISYAACVAGFTGLFVAWGFATSPRSTRVIHLQFVDDDLVQTLTSLRAERSHVYAVEGAGPVARVNLLSGFASGEGILEWTARPPRAMEMPVPVLAARAVASCRAREDAEKRVWCRREAEGLRVRNEHPFPLRNCILARSDRVLELGDIEAGADRVVPARAARGWEEWVEALRGKERPRWYMDPLDIPERRAFLLTFHSRLQSLRRGFDTGAERVIRLRPRKIDLSAELEAGAEVFAAEIDADLTGVKLDRPAAVEVRGVVRVVVRP